MKKKKAVVSCNRYKCYKPYSKLVCNAPTDYCIKGKELKNEKE